MLSGWQILTIASLALAVVLLLAACLRIRRVQRFVHTEHLPIPSQRTVEEISTCAQMAVLSLIALALMAAIAVVIAMAVR
ncbi:MAG TPA: hypothetical protein VF786_01520 [Terriglobales bacterium]